MKKNAPAVLIVMVLIAYLVYGVSTGLFSPPEGATPVQQTAHPNGPVEYQ